MMIIIVVIMMTIMMITMMIMMTTMAIIMKIMMTKGNTYLCWSLGAILAPRWHQEPKK